MIIRSMHEKYRLPDRRLILVKVLYFIPDYRHLLNEFTWQTEDEVPTLPRLHRFLRYWQQNIDAVIKDVSVANAGTAIVQWRHGGLFNV
jgi:uncharacterized protein Usg